jgi:transmembrane sensor
LDLNQTKNLLEKYRQGACTGAESKLIEDWLETIKHEGQEHFNENFIDEQLSITKNRIGDRIGVKPLIPRRKHTGWLAIAASLLIFIAISVVIRVLHSKKQAGIQLANLPGVEQHIINGWVYVQTQKGITDHIKLSDGSFITLNASSSLRYPVKFINHKRPIYLDEGEALFEVAKDKTSPFTVYTNKFATTALGTAFNIRSYAREHKVSISLIHGKIRVDDLHPAQKSVAEKILLPHQQIVLNKLSGRLITSDFKDETPITSWKEGVLAFQDATMDEVLNSIENKFNVVIKNNSTRTNWSYTGTFKDEPLYDVLKTVCLTEGISCRISNNNNITLN